MEKAELLFDLLCAHPEAQLLQSQKTESLDLLAGGIAHVFLWAQAIVEIEAVFALGHRVEIIFLSKK